MFRISSIVDMDGEVLTDEFITCLKRHLNSLLKEPFKKNDDELLSRLGFDSDGFTKYLCGKKFIVKKERIEEEPNEKGDKVAVHYVSYVVPKDIVINFVDSSASLFDDIKKRLSKGADINECDCGSCCGGGAMGIDTAGDISYTAPFGGFVTRNFGGTRKRKKKKTKRR
mgnify:CR=1 FL=1